MAKCNLGEVGIKPMLWSAVITDHALFDVHWASDDAYSLWVVGSCFELQILLWCPFPLLLLALVTVWRLVWTSAKFFSVMEPGSGCHSLGCHGYVSSQTTALISQMQIGWFDFDSLSFLTLSLRWVPSGTYRILLCLTPDNFICQWGTPWEWKG